MQWKFSKFEKSSVVDFNIELLSIPSKEKLIQMKNAKCGTEEWRN